MDRPVPPEEKTPGGRTPCTHVCLYYTQVMDSCDIASFHGGLPPSAVDWQHWASDEQTAAHNTTKDEDNLGAYCTWVNQKMQLPAWVCKGCPDRNALAGDLRQVEREGKRETETERDRDRQTDRQTDREREWFVWPGILFEEPNPTGSRPSDLIGLCKQHTKPHPPNTQGRARRKHEVYY